MVARSGVYWSPGGDLHTSVLVPRGWSTLVPRGGLFVPRGMVY